MAGRDEGPVVIVTGAGSGIGLCVCRRFSDLGYRVVLAGRRAGVLDEAGRSLGGDWLAVPTDVTDESQVGTLIRRSVEHFGRIDAVINNAGWSPLEGLGVCEGASIRAIFAVNALGPAYVVQAAWSVIENQEPMEGWPGPCIVNVSSYASVDPFPGLGVYGAAKASVNTLARACATEGASIGLRAFAVAPGAVETDLLRSLISEDQLPSEQTLEPDMVAGVIAECVLGTHDERNGETIFMASPGE